MTLKAYEGAGNISDRRRTGFHVIITILSLFLGLNFFEAFKNMARVFRWRLLLKITFSLRESVLILGGENLTNLVRLIWESRTKPMIVFACVAWIVLNLLAQGSIALINLTYNVDSGTDSKGTISGPGTVLVPKLDHYYNYNDGVPIFNEVPQVLAHSSGEAVTSRACCDYTTAASILNNTQNCYYFCRLDRQEYAFRFAEYNPNDAARAYPHFTDRIITGSATGCLGYDIDTYKRISDPDGSDAVTQFEYSNSTYSSNIKITNAHLANDATTYVYQDFRIPQNAEIFACGDRCIVIYALRNPGGITKRKRRLFECNINITEVTNTALPEHHVPNKVARLAAASIALQGRYQNPFGDATKRWRQSQLYPWSSKWETTDISAQQVGARISEFAIGSLATMAHLNPHTNLPGTLPTLASQVKVTWWGIIGLAIGIASTHALLVLVMLWVSTAVVVPDDSNLVTEMLLRTAAGRLDARESFWDGGKTALAIQGGHQAKGGQQIELVVVQSRGAHGSEEETTQATQVEEAGTSRRVAFRIVRDEADEYVYKTDEGLQGRKGHRGQESA